MNATSDGHDSILVVDDDADIRDTLQMLLEASGHRVVTAGGGAEALARLRDGLRPRLILLDLMMPGMNGLEFREKQLHEPALAAIPVVVLSGDGRIADKSEALGLPWVLKPIDLDVLLEVAV